MGVDGVPESELEAEELFAGLLAEGCSRIEVGLEQLCAERPELAEALREMAAAYAFTEQLRPRLGLFESAGPSSAIGSAGSKPELAHAAGGAASAPGWRYRVGPELGRGGMGRVVEAFDGALGRTLALKRIREDLLPTDPRDPRRAQLVQRFMAEAQITAQLDHPGIVPVHELGFDPAGEPYYTMARIEGEDLGRVFAKVRAKAAGWTVARAVEVLARVAQTVAHAHARGVVHRDLKPSNVRVGELGQVYVTDWGLARVQGVDAQTPPAVHTDRARWIEGGDARGAALATVRDHVPGTPEYMAPEQAAGRAESVGPRTDVYALGALLYELLAGRPPHLRGDSTAEELRQRVVREQPAALDALAPGAAPELVAIAQKAMAREPERRYAGALELAAELTAFREGRVVAAHRTGAWVELQKWIGRNRLAAGATAAALAFLVVGLVAALVLGQRERAAARVAGEERERAEEQSRLAEHQRERAEAATAAALANAQEAELQRSQALRRLGENHVQAARLAAQRGAWSAALEQVAAAREVGVGDGIELDLMEARAHQARIDLPAARAVLAPLLERDDLGERRAEALVRWAELHLADTGNVEQVAAWLGQALDLGLEAADASYARAILADSVPDAERHLLTAFEQDPAHLGAQRLYLVLLWFSGRLPEVLVRAEIVRLLSPEDSLPYAAEVFVHAMEGREEAVAAAFVEVQRRVAPEAVELLRLFADSARILGTLIGADLALGDQNESFDQVMQRTLVALEGMGRVIPGLRQHFAAPSLPCLHGYVDDFFQGHLALLGVDNLLSQVFAALNQPPAVLIAQSNPTRAREHYLRAVAKNPEAMGLYCLAGTYLVHLGGVDIEALRSAEPLLRQAAQAPSLIPGVGRAAHLWATMCQALLAREEGQGEMRSRALAGLRHFASLPKLQGVEVGFLSQYALLMGEPEAALGILAAGRGGPPRTAAEWRVRSELFHQYGRSTEARDALRRALELDPENVEWLSIFDRWEGF